MARRTPKRPAETGAKLVRRKPKRASAKPVLATLQKQLHDVLDLGDAAAYDAGILFGQIAAASLYKAKFATLEEYADAEFDEGYSTLQRYRRVANAFTRETVIAHGDKKLAYGLTWLKAKKPRLSKRAVARANRDRRQGSRGVRRRRRSGDGRGVAGRGRRTQGQRRCQDSSLEEEQPRSHEEEAEGRGEERARASRGRGDRRAQTRTSRERCNASQGVGAFRSRRANGHGGRRDRARDLSLPRASGKSVAARCGASGRALNRRARAGDPPAGGYELRVKG